MREAGGGKRGLPLGVAAGLPHTMRLNWTAALARRWLL